MATLRQRGVGPSEARETPTPTPDETATEGETPENGAVATLFRFPTLILLSVFGLGCAVQDVAVDHFLTDAMRHQHYRNLAHLPVLPLDGVLGVIFGLAVLNLLLMRRVPDLITIFVTAMLGWARTTQIHPRVADVSKFLTIGDGVSMGRLPSALRGIYAFNLVAIPMLLLIAFAQLYTYAVWVSEGATIFGEADVDEEPEKPAEEKKND